MIKCIYCGSENDGMSKFCENCGAELQASATQEKPEPILSQDGMKRNSYSGSETQSNNGSGSVNTNPNYDAQPPQYYSSNQNELKQEGGKNGFSIASLVCGILSLTCCCSTIFGLILAVAAVVLGIIVLRNKYDGKGMAIAGIITGGIGFLISGIILLVVGARGLMGMIDLYPENP